jgi:probable HAF family extracellular repeat protein
MVGPVSPTPADLVGGEWLMTVNAAGTVVAVARSGDGIWRAYAWDGARALRLPSLDGGYAQAFAGCRVGRDLGRGIGTARRRQGDRHQPNGRVVGNQRGTRAAYLWEDGNMIDLGTPYNRGWGDFSSGMAINDHAQVVGEMADYLGPRRAFLWEDDVFHDLGTLGVERRSTQDINNSGVVGSGAATASGEWHAFAWQDGVMTDLGTRGGASSEARGVNDAGTIVGTSQTDSGQWRAFVWRNGRGGNLRAFAWDRGRAVLLPELGEQYTVAHAVNDAGDIVGTSDRRTLLWRPDPVGRPAG